MALRNEIPLAGYPYCSGSKLRDVADREPCSAIGSVRD